MNELPGEILTVMNHNTSTLIDFAVGEIDKLTLELHHAKLQIAGGEPFTIGFDNAVMIARILMDRDDRGAK